MKVSIIIPTYNREKYIASAIQSVLDQSYSYNELIIIDDCSTDNTLKVVSQFQDDRIKLIRSEVNGGNAQARNQGIRHASGDLLFFLDSDDYYERSYLTEMIVFISENPENGFYWCGSNFINGDDQVYKREYWEPKFSLPGDSFFYELRIGTNNGICFRREVFDSCGYFEEKLRASVDRDFFLRISTKFSGKGYHKFLINCRIGTHSSLRKDYKYQALAYNYFLQIYKSKIKSDPVLRSWWFHKAMWLNLYNGNMKNAFNCYLNIPFNLKSTFIFLVFLVLGKSIGIRAHQAAGKKGISK
ncbi:hypothetical protein GCM10007049_00670 [Echinicola pacifica]|uniref:Glycosyltransferase 2-like domain-containing protein n=1 Tax=Echinicola pacifica TaxID=346377 RepID=A0A918UIP5_9BACT|nr:glycosyltransferase [Echinicola pacifica]GGZ12832.1 hypothetical protein GCM10007049_00670 [Echinicola pacifica]